MRLLPCTLAGNSDIPKFYFGEAFTGMHAAADQEDKTEQSVVTPGPLPPARELLAELLLDLNRPSEALKEFEATLTKEQVIREPPR